MKVPRRLNRAITPGLVAILGVAWFLAPFWLIKPGVAEFVQQPDPAIGRVAAAAYEAAWMRNDNPIGRLLMPAARVRRVWRDPGHCAPTDPGGGEPYADYRAEVRFYTYLGIPGKVVQVTCGGWAW